jgi:hypothetical protein
MRRLFVILALAVGMLAAVSTAGASTDPLSARGTLVHQHDGYVVTGVVRDAAARVVAVFVGRLIEETTGFNTCLDSIFGCDGGGTCNRLGGTVTVVEIGGARFVDLFVGTFTGGRLVSGICRFPDDPDRYSLAVYAGSGELPDFEFAGTAQQVSPDVLEWSTGSTGFVFLP